MWKPYAPIWSTASLAGTTRRPAGITSCTTGRCTAVPASTGEAGLSVLSSDKIRKYAEENCTPESRVAVMDMASAMATMRMILDLNERAVDLIRTGGTEDAIGRLALASSLLVGLTVPSLLGAKMGQFPSAVQGEVTDALEALGLLSPDAKQKP